MTRTYYHVTGNEYRPTDPLLSLDLLEDAGVEVEWKWGEADADTDVVCVFDSLDEARAFKADFAPDGKILEIEVSAEDLADPIAWQTRYGYITPRPVRVEEGYQAFSDGIPAEWIKGEIE